MKLLCVVFTFQSSCLLKIKYRTWTSLHVGLDFAGLTFIPLDRCVTWNRAWGWRAIIKDFVGAGIMGTEFFIQWEILVTQKTPLVQSKTTRELADSLVEGLPFSLKHLSNPVKKLEQRSPWHTCIHRSLHVACLLSYGACPPYDLTWDSQKLHKESEKPSTSPFTCEGVGHHTDQLIRSRITELAIRTSLPLRSQFFLNTCD